MKKSYLKQYFMKMLIVIILLVTVLILAVTKYTRNATENELVSLHSSVLSQSVYGPSNCISGMQRNLEDLSENSRIIEFLQNKETDPADVDRIVKDCIYNNYRLGNVFRIELYDNDSVRYASDVEALTPAKSTGIMELADEYLSQNPTEKCYLYGPYKNEQDNGIYRYSYMMVSPVVDLLTNRKAGYIFLQFSEAILYRSISQLQTNERTYVIVDSLGNVISSKNKTQLGKAYSKTYQDGSFKGDRFKTNRYDGYCFSDTDNRVWFFSAVDGSDWYLVEETYLNDLLKPVDKVRNVAMVMLVVFLVIMIPLTTVLLKPVMVSIDTIKTKMEMVAGGTLDVSIDDTEKGDGEFSEIADSFNYMVEKLRAQLQEIKRSERNRHELRLDFLQTQINPHFIYNTLSSIRFYVEMGKNEKAEKMLIDFSKILRKTLSRSDKFITLREELETLNNYIDLQKARYTDRFELCFHIQEETLPFIIPDFILQPIVENAIFYSLKEEGACHIDISSFLEENILNISIKDDGIGMTEDKINEVLDKSLHMNKVGVRNVHERLQLYYGENYGLKIISEEGVGTEVIMRIPEKAEVI